MFQHNHWITDLTNYEPKNSHYLWSAQQAAFSVSTDGKILLSDNLYYSEINTLLNCFGEQNKGYLGLYCWENKLPELYVFCELKIVIIVMINPVLD